MPDYSDEQRAEVMLSLKVSDGNVKRTSRETQIPESTVFRWKKKWAADGVPQEILNATVERAGEFTQHAKRLRQSALGRLADALANDDVKPAQLITVIGVLTDKINLADGFATSRTDTVTTVTLPSPDDTAKYVEDTYKALEDRNRTIEGNASEPAKLALARPKE